MNLFTSGLALTGLVTLPLTLGGQESNADAQPASEELRPLLLKTRTQPASQVADGFSRFQPRSEAARNAQGLPGRVARPGYVPGGDDKVKAKLEAEIARLEAEIAALSGKAAALEASDVAVKVKGLARSAEREATLEATDAAIQALNAQDWAKLMQEHNVKLKGLNLDSQGGHQIVTWSGADGQTGYGLFDGEAENVIYFDGQEGSAKQLKEYIAKGIGDLDEYFVEGDGAGGGHSWVFRSDGDSGDAFEWLNGADGDAWIGKLDGDVALFRDLGDDNFWTEDGEAHDLWGAIATGGAQGGKPAEVYSKVIVSGHADTDRDEIVRVIDSIRAHGDGKYDITIATTDDGEVIEKRIARYVDTQAEPSDAKARFEAIKLAPGERNHGDVDVLYKDAVRVLTTTGEPHDSSDRGDIALFKRSLEQAHGGGHGGQNPFVQRVEVHNHNKPHAEHDDLRDLLEAMAADLTEVRHEVKAIRALLEGGEPLGMAPVPAVPGFPAHPSSAPRAGNLNATEPGQIASLYEVAREPRAPRPAVAGSLVAPSFPAEPKGLGAISLEPAELPDMPPAPVKVLELPARLPKDAPNN